MTVGGGESKTGYRRPPAATRFRKGESGNLRGRPQGRKSQPPFEAVLGQIVTIRDGGVERRVTAAEAFLLYMANEGLKGDGAAGRAIMTAIERAKAFGLTENKDIIRVIVRVIVTPGSVTRALELLRMATKLDRYRDTAKMMLEPWLVEIALARLGGQRLTIDQQKEVARVTRALGKVRWPEWWEGQGTRPGRFG
ncbi:MAG: hypothetical protein EPO55_21410 [Reyranella sp.]|uniref:DUF5681 domain-containing protein n=1 Tax=Reyranella sp. TaxID=1929291 RepID=UPI001220FB21|nr:DUF5681 domain-containing protein [Reyranella sp.]TAJ36631.1 MAG: hypothetical protein EPO55_21410 [Reyranella sp.]